MIKSTEMDDDTVWDRIVDFVVSFGGATLIGALYFLTVLIMDVHWRKAIIISLIVIACVVGKLGVYTIRKMAIGFTAYAFGYLIGALPNVGAIGTYFTRLLS